MLNLGFRKLRCTLIPRNMTKTNVQIRVIVFLSLLMMIKTGLCRSLVHVHNQAGGHDTM